LRLLEKIKKNENSIELEINPKKVIYERNEREKLTEVQQKGEEFKKKIPISH